MLLTVEDCMGIMSEIAPPVLAETWDAVGLQVGHPQQPVRRIGVALDATHELVAEAVEKRVDFLAVHHPLFFRPLRRLDLSTPSGRVIETAVRNGLSIYAAHTNLDSAVGGMNDALCRKIALQDIRVMGEEKTFPEVVAHLELPEKMAERVRELVEAAGRDICWWRAMDTEKIVGRCRLPADRLRGLRGKMHALCPEICLTAIPAGDGASGAGPGRIGELKAAVPLKLFGEKVKKDLGLRHVRMVGDPMRPVRRVAVCTGSGAGLMAAVLGCGADVFLTGDVKYHEAMEALDQGLALVDAGHFGTESLVVDLLVMRMTAILSSRGIPGVDVVPLSGGRDPFYTL